MTVTAPYIAGAREAWVDDKLVCPVCKGRLTRAVDVLSCEACAVVYPQPAGYFDLLARASLEDAETWDERQDECDGWYENLIADPAEAAKLLLGDHEAFRDILSQMDGDVLDIGGGNGVPRAYLPRSARYLSLEPSVAWFQPGWAQVAAYIPALRQPPTFVRGVGEALPFADGAFDAVMMFWSLNHVENPGRSVGEAARVLKPGGSALLVLEDMRPSFADVFSKGFWQRSRRVAVTQILQMVRSSITGAAWPLQSDHVRITDAEMQTWSGPSFNVSERAWIGGYLTYRLVRTVRGASVRRLP